VVYGFFGVFVLNDFFRDEVKPFIGSTLGLIPIFSNVVPRIGNSILLASTVLAVMILPTVTILSLEAMRSVPKEYKEASIALGATHWETVKKIVIPASISGIVTAFMLGIMRAMGETMAVVMLTGNTLKMPTSVLDVDYAMTSKILNDMMYWFPDDYGRSALLGIAAVLFSIEFGVLMLTKGLKAVIK
jgi:phosphate transport system permease protein